MIVVGLALACGLGALVRYRLSHLNASFPLPMGTLLANLLGAFLIGYAYKHLENKEVYIILVTGFCGGLTTFSSLQAEFLALWKEQKKLYLYFALSYALGLAAIFLGIIL
ncbi:fluoride efflux transporter CrcB [Streptococcus oricebi]|uniref:Fluoride-specific ion channel FluC n=1 Tax=Streptococcus oricebi TaxID=1547447 RepID=A0ABS5B0T1_9STRE|nr:fluoride efflux transporter CrcB [Streptococcus oricebi]MBP2622435.1 camphor resistance protein CrcB [Streptococcus oricebi]